MVIIFFALEFSLSLKKLGTLTPNCFKAYIKIVSAVASSNQPNIGIKSVGSGINIYIPEKAAIEIQNNFFIIFNLIIIMQLMCQVY